jgi:hypothetical protein
MNTIIPLDQVEITMNEGLTLEQKKLKYEYVETLSGNPYQVRNKGASYVPVNSSLKDFIDQVKELVDCNQQDKKNKVILVDDFSPNNIFEDPTKPGSDVVATIGYRLRKRAPGTTKGGNKPFNDARREVTPHLRAITTDDVGNPGAVTFNMGQWFDNELRFEIYARTNKEANEVAMWFENIMDLNRQFFAYRGIMKYYFLERESDTVVKEGDGTIHCRPMCYWVRTEKCYEITEQAINNIVILLTTT